MNMKLMSGLCAVCAGAALAATTLPAHASKKLAGAEIKKMMPGSYTLVIYGFNVGVSATGGGGLTVTLLGDTMKGKWSVKGDQLCITLVEGNKSESGCSQVTFDGKKFYSAGGVRFYAR